MRAWAIFSLTLLSIAQPAWTEAKQRGIVVDIHAPRADIRNTLLMHTPVGSNMGTVVDFISNQLEIAGSVLDIRVQPAKAALVIERDEDNSRLPGPVLQTSRVPFS